MNEHYSYVDEAASAKMGSSVKRGPFNRYKMKSLFNSGQINGDTEIKASSTGSKWMALKDHYSLWPFVSSSHRPTRSMQMPKISRATTPEEKSRVIASLTRPNTGEELSISSIAEPNSDDVPCSRPSSLPPIPATPSNASAISSIPLPSSPLNKNPISIADEPEPRQQRHASPQKQRQPLRVQQQNPKPSEQPSAFTFKKPVEAHPPRLEPGMTGDRKKADNGDGKWGKKNFAAVFTDVRLMEKSIHSLDDMDLTKDNLKEIQKHLGALASRLKKFPRKEAPDSPRIKLLLTSRIMNVLVTLFDETSMEEGGHDDTLLFLNEYVVRILYLVSSQQPRLTCPALGKVLSEALGAQSHGTVRSLPILLSQRLLFGLHMEGVGKDGRKRLMPRVKPETGTFNRMKGFFAKKKDVQLESEETMLAKNRRMFSPRLLLLYTLLVYNYDEDLEFSLPIVRGATRSILTALDACRVSKNDKAGGELLVDAVRVLVLMNMLFASNSVLLEELESYHMKRLVLETIAMTLPRFKAAVIASPKCSEFKVYASTLEVLTQFYHNHTNPHEGEWGNLARCERVSSYLRCVLKHISIANVQDWGVLYMLRCCKSILRVTRNYWDTADVRPMLIAAHDRLQAVKAWAVKTLDHFNKQILARPQLAADKRNQQLLRQMRLVNSQLDLILPIVQNTLKSDPIVMYTREEYMPSVTGPDLPSVSNNCPRQSLSAYDLLAPGSPDFLTPGVSTSVSQRSSIASNFSDFQKLTGFQRAAQEEVKQGEAHLCGECMQDTAATHKCLDCEDLLCALHATAHTQSRKTHKHTLIPVDASEPASPVSPKDGPAQKSEATPGAAPPTARPTTMSWIPEVPDEEISRVQVSRVHAMSWVPTPPEVEASRSVASLPPPPLPPNEDDTDTDTGKAAEPAEAPCADPPSADEGDDSDVPDPPSVVGAPFHKRQTSLSKVDDADLAKHINMAGELQQALKQREESQSRPVLSTPAATNSATNEQAPWLQELERARSLKAKLKTNIGTEVEEEVNTSSRLVEVVPTGTKRTTATPTKEIDLPRPNDDPEAEGSVTRPATHAPQMQLKPINDDLHDVCVSIHPYAGGLRQDAELKFAKDVLIRVSVHDQLGWSYGAFLEAKEMVRAKKKEQQVVGWFPASYVSFTLKPETQTYIRNLGKL